MIKIDREEKDGGILGDMAPDMTPMLDVMFILLVFFLLTMGTVMQSLDLQLPTAVEEELPDVNKPRHIMLEIREDSYAIDGRPYTEFDDFKTGLQTSLADKPDHDVIVAGDRRISIEELLKVLTYLQSQGVEAANILMQKEATP